MSDRLTDRERAVVLSMAMGNTYEETAEAMSVSLQTVKNHLQHASHKYNATNVRHLIWLLGWITPERSNSMPAVDKHDDIFTLTDEDQPLFYSLVDSVHGALMEERGCHHPKFQPNQCALVTKRLWLDGVRPAK